MQHNPLHFVDRLRELSDPPTWQVASTLGAELIHPETAGSLFHQEHDRIVEQLTELDMIDTTSDSELARRQQNLVDDAAVRLEYLTGTFASFTDPTRYHLASGEVVDFNNGDPIITAAPVAEDTRHVRSGGLGRLQIPGIATTAHIHPTATIHPTASIEPDAIIGPHAHLAADVHVGAGSYIEHHARINDGTWVGPGATLRRGCVVGQGAVIGARSDLGATSVVGDGAVLSQGTVLDSHNRVAPRTDVDQSRTGMSPTRNRAHHVAGAIHHLMNLDR